MPAMAIATHILPVAIVIQIVCAGYVVVYILIARKPLIRIVVERIAQVTIVVNIATIVTAWVAITIIVVHQRARRAGFYARQRRSGRTLTRHRKDFALFDATAA